MSSLELRAHFHTLHRSGCFVIPNPWDAGSARILASLGFKALATTSSGFAWSTGRRDNHVTVDDVLAHLFAIADAVDVPVNADFEAGFAIAFLAFVFGRRLYGVSLAELTAMELGSYRLVA
jgi:2-methylisocitrate lyase-like PEP mutase family enzyme